MLYMLVFNRDSIIQPENGYDFLTDYGAYLIDVHLISVSNEYNGLRKYYGYYLMNSHIHISLCNIFGYSYLRDDTLNIRYLINVSFVGNRNATYNLLLSKFRERQLEKLID